MKKRLLAVLFLASTFVLKAQISAPAGSVDGANINKLSGVAISGGLSNVDALTGAINTLPVTAFTALFNGATWDRQRTATLANLTPAITKTAVNSVGAGLSEKGSRWRVVSSPASGTIASASLAAETAVRHTIDCVSFAADSSAAVTAANLVVNIRDGATGAGTVIYTWTIGLPTAAGIGAQEVPPHSVCGLNLTGSTNTAMTVEFSTGVTGLLESISFTGFNVN